VAALEAPSPLVRRSAAAALRRLGARGASAAPELAARLDRPELRQEVAQALRAIAPEVALPAVAAALPDLAAEHRRRAATHLLQRAGDVPPAARPEVAAALGAVPTARLSAEVRSILALATVELSPDGGEGLVRLLSEEPTAWIPEALRRLDDLSAEQRARLAPHVAAAWLASEDPDLRRRLLDRLRPADAPIPRDVGARPGGRRRPAVPLALASRREGDRGVPHTGRAEGRSRALARGRTSLAEAARPSDRRAR